MRFESQLVSPGVQKFRSLFSGQLLGPSLKLGIATAGSQGLVVVLSPLLTRLYTPAEYGMFGAFASVVSILLVAGSLRFETAIPLPEEEQTAISLTMLAFASLAVTTTISGILLFLFRDSISSLFDMTFPAEAVFAVSLALALSGTAQIFSLFALRVRDFNNLAISRLAQGGLSPSTQALLGTTGLGLIGLILGDLVGRLVGAVALLRFFFRHKTQGQSFALTTSELRKTCKRYRSFPLLSSWTSLLNTAGSQLPVLLLATLFNSAAAGVFLLSLRVVQTPVALVGQALGQAFFSRISREKDQAHQVTSQVLKHLLSAGTFPILMLATVGPSLFSVAFGDSWASAGIYGQWFCPWIMMVLLASPISSLVFVLERQREELFFQLLLLLCRLAAVFIGWQMGSIDVAVLLFAGLSFICWFAYFLWLLTLTKIKVGSSLFDIARELLTSGAIVVPVAITAHFYPRTLLLVGAIVAATTLYVIKTSWMVKKVGNV